MFILARVPISSFCFYILQSDIYFEFKKIKRDKYTWLCSFVILVDFILLRYEKPLNDFIIFSASQVVLFTKTLIDLKTILFINQVISVFNFTGMFIFSTRRTIYGAICLEIFFH